MERESGMGKSLYCLRAVIACLSAVCLSGSIRETEKGDGPAACGSVLWDAGRLGDPVAERGMKEREAPGERLEARRWEGREWTVEEDGAEISMGRNITSHGSILERGEDYVFAAGGKGLRAGMELYGGPDVPGKEDYSIYRLKDNRWELFASHPPESVNNKEITRHNFHDETSVSNLVCHDGFLYYSLLYDNAPGEGSDEEKYIYRIPEQGGEPEELALAYDTFYIYRGKIYYRTLEERKGGRCWKSAYWEMEPDGTGKRLVCRAENDLHDVGMFTVGGGCLYVKHGNKLMGVNLGNGNRKYFLFKKNADRIYYEDGFLYMHTDGASISRMNVITGETEGVSGKACKAYLGAGLLCFIQKETLPGEVEYCLNVMDLRTGGIASKRFRDTGENVEEEVMAHLGAIDDWIVVVVYIPEWYGGGESRFYFRYGNGMLLEEKNGGNGI